MSSFFSLYVFFMLITIAVLALWNRGHFQLVPHAFVWKSVSNRYKGIIQNKELVVINIPDNCVIHIENNGDHNRNQTAAIHLERYRNSFVWKQSDLLALVIDLNQFHQEKNSNNQKWTHLERAMSHFKPHPILFCILSTWIK